MNRLVPLAVILATGFMNTSQAQEPALNFPRAIAEAESLVFSDSSSISPDDQIRKLLRIATFVNAELAGSSGRSFSGPGTVSSTGGPCQQTFEPCCPPKRGICRLFHRCRNVCEPVCVVDDPRKPPTYKKELAMSVLREHSGDLVSELLDIQAKRKPADSAKLRELARQVYSLAVISKEPFTPGSTKNGTP